ncbi:MAG TPA: hypothetical protein VGC41_01040 [Kofleriaceae bacterium]
MKYAALAIVAACSSTVAPVTRVAPTDPILELLGRVDSVEQLVPLLPEDLRRSFTFVFATRSPQQDVDPLHPRVVLFGTDARTILAFTGDPKGLDLDTVELIRFRDDLRAFELQRFVLPAAVRRNPSLATLAKDNGHINPADCLRCHGADPRPLFDSYPVWPGFYGSAQDAFAIAPDELASYRAFLAARTGVYTELAYPEGSEVSPYSLAPAEDQTGRFAPNMRLGMALTELNRKRIARKLETSPRYPLYRDALIAGLLGCAPLPITLADRMRVQAALDAEDAAKLDRARITDPDERHRLRMTEINSFDNLTEIEYVARVLDVSRADWSMATEPGAYALYDGILSGRIVDGGRAKDFYFKEDFLLEMLRGTPAFATVPYTIDHRKGTRLDLHRAIASCGQFDAATTLPPVPPAAPMIVYRCVRCHEPEGIGPPIPFDSPTQMHALLERSPELADEVAARTTLGAEIRMPLDQPPLPKPERAELLGYIQSVR